MRLVSIAMACGLLIACAPVGPDFHRPESWSEPEWLLASQERYKAEPMELIEWWQVLNDPILNQLVVAAQQSNNNLKVAGLRVIEARAALGITVGRQYPQSQAMAGDATVIGVGDSGANSSAGDLNFSQYSLGVGASWEIDFWGKFRRGIESADASLLASIANFDDVFILLIAQVADTYTLVRVTEQQLRIAEENLELQKRSYDIASVLYRNGENSELDALQAKTLLLATEATIPGLDATLRQTKNALSTLLGRPPGDISALLGGASSLPAVPEELSVGIPADLLRQRPDVRRAEMLAMAQNALVGVAQADLYPSFSISGSLGFAADSRASGDSGIGELFSADSLVYSVGPSFVWPFLNYGRIQNNIRVQDARLQQALIQYRETVIQAAREVEDSMAAFSGAHDQGLILSQTVDAARRSSDLSLLRYKEGFADYQRVLDSQQSLFTQEQRYATNQANVIRALIGIYRGLGGGWQSQQGDSYVDADTRQEMEQRTNWGDQLEPGQAVPHRVNTD
jgi:NodT family efflux transporter outer membrane factor (OMF) lipoprotein